MSYNKIGVDSIKYLENLMKIQVSEDKRQQFVKELGEIVGYFDELTKIDFSQIDSILALNTNQMRSDIIENSSNTHKALSLPNASNTLGDYYKVAQVIK